MNFLNQLLKSFKGEKFIHFLETIFLNTVKAFKIIISKRRKPNKIWVDQSSEFYNNSFKDFLKINDIEMYSTSLF